MNTDIEDLIKQCALEIILPRWRNLGANDIKSKTSATDLVTVADIESEYFLQREIPLIDEGAIVVGEESVSRGEYSFEDLEELKDKTFYVVDPVDGTNNFVKGSETFAVMVAKLVKGVCEEAWIYFPALDRMTYAKKGHGAFKNGEKVSTSIRTDISDIQGYVSLRYMKEKDKAHFRNVIESLKVHDSTSCAADMYCNVAHGDMDFTVFTRIKPWDHLPGVLICQEAGGYNSNFYGEEYSIYARDKALLTANNKTTWQALHDMLISPLDL